MANTPKKKKKITKEGNKEEKGGEKKASATTQSSEDVKCLGKNSVSPEAEAAINAFVQATITAGIKGLRSQFIELSKSEELKKSHEAYTANPKQNRYSNIICWDESRVVLTLNVPPERDYIHGNWIKMDHVTRPIIATQAPLDNTIGDFWRMVFQENVAVILMLCQCHEDGKEKCAQYWKVKAGDSETYAKIKVTTTKVQKEDKFCVNTMELSLQKNSKSVKLIQLFDWPDKDVPSSSKSISSILNMLHEVEGPAVVHCSAGVGRTGTLIAIETAIQRLWKGQIVNFPAIIQQLRNQRHASVQTPHQYIFCHIILLFSIVVSCPQHEKSIELFNEEYQKKKHKLH